MYLPDQVLGTTPPLEVLVWYPVCTYSTVVYILAIRLCHKLKPNVFLTLREVNCMLAIWSRVKDLRQACDMKCTFVSFCFRFGFFNVFVVEGYFYFFEDQLVILVL